MEEAQNLKDACEFKIAVADLEGAQQACAPLKFDIYIYIYFFFTIVCENALT